MHVYRKTFPPISIQLHEMSLNTIWFISFTFGYTQLLLASVQFYEESISNQSSNFNGIYRWKWNLQSVTNLLQRYNNLH